MPTTSEIPKSLDRAFDAYRRNGDLQALGRVFDATAQRLVLLAARIVGDPHLAEDVLQRTFVTAIEKREAWDARRPLWPWLTGILAREAQAVRRSARRAPDVARLGGSGMVEAPDDQLCRRESIEHVLAAIEALGPAYRQVLVLHLVHGLQAAQIATALDLPGGTVRSRLTRGLARLRANLPAALAVAWLPTEPVGAGVAEVEAVRRAVLEVGARAVPVAGSGIAMGAVAGLFTTLLMSKTQITVAGIALALLGLFLLVGPSPLRGGEVEPAQVEIVPAAGRVDSDAPEPEPRSSRVLAVAEPEAEPAPQCLVTGRIHDVQGRPVPGAEVRIVAHHGGLNDPVEVAAWTDIEIAADGSFAVSLASIFELPPSVRRTAKLVAYPRAVGFWTYTYNIPDHREPWLPGRDPEYHFDIEMEPYRNVIRGRVVDAGGLPVEGAKLVLNGPEDHVRHTWLGAGSFAIRAHEVGTYHIAATHPDLGVTVAPATVEVTDSSGEQQLGDLVLRPAVEVEGTLRMADGSPAAHVAASLRSLEPDPSAGYALARVAFVTDESGRFRVRSLRESLAGYALSVPYLHRRGDPGYQTFAIDPRAGPIDLELQGQHLAITVRDPEGHVVGDWLGIRAWLPPETPDPEAMERLLTHGDRVPGGVSCQVPYGFAGRLAAVVATDSVLIVKADAVGCFPAAAWHRADLGVARAAIDLTLQAQVPGVGGRLRFDVRDERGTPVTDFAVRVSHPAAALVVEDLERSALGPDGVSGPLPPGRLSLSFRSGPRVLEDAFWDRCDEPVVVHAEVVEGRITDVPVQIVRRGVVRLALTRRATEVFLNDVRIRGSGASGEIDWTFKQRDPDGSYTGAGSIWFQQGYAGPVFAYGRAASGPVSISIEVPGERVRQIRAEVRPHEVTAIPVDLDAPPDER